MYPNTGLLSNYEINQNQHVFINSNINKNNFQRSHSHNINYKHPSNINSHQPINPINTKITIPQYSNNNPLNTIINIKAKNNQDNDNYNQIKRIRSLQTTLIEEKNFQLESKETPTEKLSNVTQKRNLKSGSLQMDRNLNIRNTTTNGVRPISIQLKMCGNHNPDNVSNISKISKGSHHHILRPVSINNEDHLFNLVEKENCLRKANTKIADEFLNKINNTKQNVIINMKNNFLNRVNMIWSSYMKEQIKNQKLKVDRSKLHQEVERIKEIFNQNLELKTEIYIESLKNKTIKDIFKNIEEKNNQKIYLDEEIGYLMNNQYKEITSKNQQLESELLQITEENKKVINDTLNHYEELRENHLEAYNNEFCFKLAGDKDLVKTTLLNSLPFLQKKYKQINEKLIYLQSKNNEQEFRKLEQEIAILESSISKYK